MREVRPSQAQEIKAMAHRLGFDLVRFTSAAPLESARAILNDWCQSGQATGLGYITRDPQCRTDPKRILQEARSVITLGVSYFSGDFPPAAGPDFARIARYAWGQDYHEVILNRLHILHEAMNQIVGHPVQIRTGGDAQPILERALSERAGVGFFGKNTNIVARGMGSWIFLTEVFTELDLPPDTPVKLGCGTCVKCLEACPTQALTPYHLDARLCISYLTIENREEIPEELRPKIGDRLFGCDLCQECCPYNRQAKRATWPEFEPERGEGPWMSLSEVLALRTSEEFKHRFKRTPLLRAKRTGLLRNACVVAGNLRCASLIPLLIEILNEEPEPLIRSHAAWALGQMPQDGFQRRIQSVLGKTYRSDPSNRVRQQAQNVLQRT